MRAAIGLAIILALPSTVLAEKIFTWTDEDGVTQYGDRPPRDSSAQEVKVQGFQRNELVIPASELEGNWRIIEQNGQIQNWVIREDGRIQMDIRDGANRTVINGAWQMSSSIMTVTSELIQEIRGGEISVDEEPIQYIFKFIEFQPDRFRVFANGGNMSATRL